MPDSHLQIKDLWHNYGNSHNNSWTLQSLDLNLGNGELLGLLGPSGCGKTTLLRLIAGFEKPDKGTICTNGQLISSPSYLLAPERRGIGMVFQDYALFPHLTVWQNVCFGVKRSNDRDRAKWLLDLVGIAPFSSRYPHELSGGQRQRLALARALAPGNSLVLLDEPFCSLDVEVRYRLRNELSRILNSCSASALLVTHDPHEALAICDRVAVMKEGQIQQCATPVDMATKPKTPFVGQFVFQKNYIPIDIKNGYVTTPIGEFSTSILRSDIAPSGILVDQDGLSVTYDPEGFAMVVAREYLGNYWLIVAKQGDQLFRINQPIDNVLQVRDRCKISFKEGENAFLYPGCFQFKLV